MEQEKTYIPLVSVPVVIYNSAKTILETLESIKAQTYPNIELIISDDCSTDNTVALCRDWIDKNKERFIRVEIIVPDHNTGVAGNCNRAYAACEGEWIKSIAGDDLLMPNCIQDCVDYVIRIPDTIYLFGRCKAFGASEDYCKQIDENFDYTFFALTQEQQLHRLIFEGNCVPGTTMFFHRERSYLTGVKDDSRVPLMEDWPRWINLLRAGVKFHFVDKVLVKYRVGGISTSAKLPSPKYHRSERMFYYLYQFPERYKEDPQRTIEEILREECRVYDTYYTLFNSKAYRLGKALLKPFSMFKRYRKE